MTNLDKFAYIGGFIGNCGGFGLGNDAPDMKTICGCAFGDPAAFNAKVKVLFLGIGATEGPGTKNISDALMKAGVHNLYFESPEAAHEWLTWRRALNEFAPRLFKWQRETVSECRRCRSGAVTNAFADCRRSS